MLGCSERLVRPWSRWISFTFGTCGGRNFSKAAVDHPDSNNRRTCQGQCCAAIILKLASPARQTSACSCQFGFGRGSRVRTRDLRFWRPSLYQLSYTPSRRTELRGASPVCKDKFRPPYGKCDRCWIEQCPHRRDRQFQYRRGQRHPPALPRYARPAQVPVLP